MPSTTHHARQTDLSAFGPVDALQQLGQGVRPGALAGVPQRPDYFLVLVVKIEGAHVLLEGFRQLLLHLLGLMGQSQGRTGYRSDHRPRS